MCASWVYWDKAQDHRFAWMLLECTYNVHTRAMKLIDYMLIDRNEIENKCA